MSRIGNEFLFSPASYCGDVPQPSPDNQAIDDMFTAPQRDALRKMIKEEISKAMKDQPSNRKGKKKQNFVGRVEEE